MRTLFRLPLELVKFWDCFVRTTSLLAKTRAVSRPGFVSSDFFSIGIEKNLCVCLRATTFNREWILERIERGVRSLKVWWCHVVLPKCPSLPPRWGLGLYSFMGSTVNVHSPIYEKRRKGHFLFFFFFFGEFQNKTILSGIIFLFLLYICIINFRV